MLPTVDLAALLEARKRLEAAIERIKPAFQPLVPDDGPADDRDIRGWYRGQWDDVRLSPDEPTVNIARGSIR